MDIIKKLVPFSLEKALQGELAVTRQFKIVNQITKFIVEDEDSQYCIAGVIQSDRGIGLGTWMVNGKWDKFTTERDEDLFHVEHYKKVYVLVWIGANGSVCVTQEFYESFDLADAERDKIKKSRPNEVFEIHINDFLFKI